MQRRKFFGLLICSLTLGSISTLTSIGNEPRSSEPRSNERDTAHSENSNVILVRAKHVVLGTGETISPGAVLVESGKIKIVAGQIDAPDIETVEVDWVMPGLVNAAASYGIAGGTSEISTEVAPDFYTSFSLNPNSRDFKEAIDEGITTAHLLPGTQSVIAGCSSIIKISGGGHSQDKPTVLTEKHGLTIALSSDPTSRNQARGRPDTIFMRQPTNRMGVVWILRSAMHKTQNDQPASFLTPESRSIIASAMKGELPIYSVSRKDVDIRSTFVLQDEFGVRPIIIGGDEAYRIMADIIERKPSIIYTDLTSRSSSAGLRGPEGTERRWNVASQFAAAGIDFCLAGSELLDQARFATRFGLDRNQAMKSITLSPAKILKIDQQVGSIETNKDADLIAFNGDPLEFTSSIQWVMVNGKIHSAGSDKK
ncbi:MAG: amidohydrolase family protein [Pirellula sp.]|jgi:imidazolonepropionase-like amidohydrolase|nr:amidohydrolase family protein [Pirellula sp.]